MRLGAKSIIRGHNNQGFEMSVTFNNNELNYSHYCIRQLGGKYQLVNRLTGEVIGSAGDCDQAADICLALEQSWQSFGDASSFAGRAETKSILLRNGGSLI